MKRFRLLLLLVLLAAMLAFAVVSCGDDDDDDDTAADDDDNADDDDAADDDSVDDDDANDDDDNADDDDSGDDDDATATVSVDNVTVDTCNDDNPDLGQIPADIVEATWHDGVLTVNRINAFTYCSEDWTVSATLEDGVLTLVEDHGEPADCTCLVNATYDILDIPQGNIEMVVEVSESSLKANLEVARYTIKAGADNVAYMTPELQNLIAEETYPANQEMDVRMQICHNEDISNWDTDSNIIQFYTTYREDYIRIYVVNRHNLTNPGVIESVCADLHYLTPGVGAGNHIFLGFGYDWTDTNTYTMKSKAVTIE